MDTKKIRQALSESLERLQRDLAIVSDDVERLRDHKTRRAAGQARESLRELMRLIKNSSDTERDDGRTDTRAS